MPNDRNAPLTDAELNAKVTLYQTMLPISKTAEPGQPRAKSREFPNVQPAYDAEPEANRTLAPEMVEWLKQNPQ